MEHEQKKLAIRGLSPHLSDIIGIVRQPMAERPVCAPAFEGTYQPSLANAL
jgi:hypothetical protein